MLRPSIRYACLETKAFMCMFGSYGTHVFSSHSLKPENGCSKLSDTVQQSNHRLVDNTRILIQHVVQVSTNAWLAVLCS